MISCWGHLADLYGLINVLNALILIICSGPAMSQTQGLCSPGHREAWAAAGA